MSRDDWELVGFGLLLGFVAVLLIAAWTGAIR